MKEKSIIQIEQINKKLLEQPSFKSSIYLKSNAKLSLENIKQQDHQN